MVRPTPPPPGIHERYYNLSPDHALEILREKVDEWEYDKDPHGYCHDRSAMLAVVERAELLRERGLW